MAANPGIKTEAYAMSKMQLEKQAVQVSRLRREIQEKAKEMMLAQDKAAVDKAAVKETKDDEHEKSTFEVSRLAKKIRSREQHVAKLTGPISTVDYPE